METYEAVVKRLEVREYSGERVPDHVKLKILEAARMSPTGLNLQHWRFILVEEKESLKKLAELSTSGRWVAGADFAIIVLTNPKYPFHMIDAGRAIQNMQLVGWSEGVGSCIYTGFREKEMKKEFRIPDEMAISAVVGFGYPKEKLRGKKNRKPLSEIAYSERYGDKLRLS
ncbi:MAG: nitroreductase family protein [Candidatus Caldarchaeales archaeon]